MIAGRKPFLSHAFEYACTLNDVDHRLTKPKHPGTVRPADQPHHQGRDCQTLLLRNRDRLRAHLRDFIDACITSPDASRPSDASPLMSSSAKPGLPSRKDSRSRAPKNAGTEQLKARSALTESWGDSQEGASQIQPAGWVWRPACMARAYSLDLRERVVAAVASGQSCRAAAKTLTVSVASVVKWSQRQRAVGSPAALKMGGRRPYLVAREELGSGADRPEARSHAAGSAQGAGRPRPGGQLLCALAFSPA